MVRIHYSPPLVIERITEKPFDLREGYPGFLPGASILSIIKG
jgi:hypothetical protein